MSRGTRHVHPALSLSHTHTVCSAFEHNSKWYEVNAIVHFITQC